MKLKYKITCACGARIRNLKDAEDHWACYVVNKDKFKYEKIKRGKRKKV